MMEETDRLLKILHTAVRVLGFTKQRIEDKLGVYHGYLGRVLTGVTQLQFEDIVRIARALDMEPAEIFQLAYPQTPNPGTEGARRLREALQSLQPAAPAPEASASAPPVPAATTASGLSAAIEQELDRMVERKFEQLLNGLAKGTSRE
jgi:transcriptional regulator with XRE-family HTH domain